MRILEVEIDNIRNEIGDVVSEKARWLYMCKVAEGVWGREARGAMDEVEGKVKLEV